MMSAFRVTRVDDRILVSRLGDARRYWSTTGQRNLGVLKTLRTSVQVTVAMYGVFCFNRLNLCYQDVSHCHEGQRKESELGKGQHALQLSPACCTIVGLLSFDVKRDMTI